MRKNVDIIIPIYNAYEYTSDCIKSVIKYTDLKNNRLVLVEDRSTDKNILAMLKKYREENKDLDIVLIENEQNLGFVKTANKGMQYSKENDVVLLNSDTEVTLKWLEKMQNCAYSDEYISTVTPLSNNGALCSIPNFGVDNELPENLTLDEYAKLVEDCSYKRYPEISTAIGFCMYIKRSVLDEIGFLDEETFGKGYGEENDLCYRALDFGYIHVMCDDTFVYHKGTQSFTEAKKELINSHMKILKERYPTYVYRTDRYIAENPLKDIQDNISVNLALHNKKKVLYLIHEWGEDMNSFTGGTSLHLKDIIIGRKEQVSLVLCPDKNNLNDFKLYVYVDAKIFRIYDFVINETCALTHYSNREYKNMLNKIIKCFSIDLIHVHHTIFHTFDIASCAKENNIYSIITLHDLYYICPSINMLYKEVYCLKLENKNCQKCLAPRLGVKNDILPSWQKNSKIFLEKFDKIIVPSNNTKTLYNNVYNNLNIEVIEHGLDISNFEKRIIGNNKKEINKKEFNIAFIGVMTIHKGSKLLKEFIKINNTDNIKIHLFGKTEDEYLKKSTNNYIFHGKYLREDLPKLLKENNIDLICIFSTWPETFSYTLTEALIAKIPVISYNIGAVSDRIQKSNVGYTVDYNEKIKNIWDKIKKISLDEKGYKEISNNFNMLELKTLEQMNEEYKEIYLEASLKSKKTINYIDINKVLEFKNRLIYKEFEKYKSNYGHVVHKYERLRASIVWKIGKKIKRFVRNR